MNELIKELADKHGLAWTLKTPYDEENLRDFTRAIVEECITACATDRLGKTASPEELMYSRFGIDQ